MLRPSEHRENHPVKADDLLRRTQKTLALAGISEAALEAEVLLRHVLGMDRAALYAAPETPVEPNHQAELDALVARRLRREPLAYILGQREFFGLAFRVTPAVMVPRQETELLVDLALQWAAGRSGVALRIADVGTGSGCIAVSLAAHLPGAQLLAVDISREALEVARENCHLHGLDGQVHLLQGDLLEPLRAKVDLIVANLPYIPAGELPSLQPEVRQYEPRQALTPGPDPSALVRRLLAQAPALLHPRGALFLEAYPFSSGRLRQEASRLFPEAAVRVVKDLAGWDRALAIILPLGHRAL